MTLQNLSNFKIQGLPPTKIRRGFTLVELLIVVGIVATLVGILLPALVTARRHAREAVCKSNLHQLITGWTAYAVAHRGHPVSSWHATAKQTPNGLVGVSWLTLLRPYIGSDADTCRCPVAEVPTDLVLQNGLANRNWCSNTPSVISNPAEWVGGYGYNNFFEFTTQILFIPPTAYYRTLSTVDEPDNAPVMADANWMDIGWPFDTDKLPADFNDPNVTGNGDMSRVCLNRHHGGVNVAFADGSVKWIEIRSLWSLKWHTFFRTRPTF